MNDKSDSKADSNKESVPLFNLSDQDVLIGSSKLNQLICARLASDQANNGLIQSLIGTDLKLSANLRNQTIRVLIDSIKLLESRSISDSNKNRISNQIDDLMPFMMNMEIKEKLNGSADLKISYLKRNELILNFVAVCFVILNHEKVSNFLKTRLIEDSRRLIKDLESLDREFSGITERKLSSNEEDEESWSSEGYKDEVFQQASSSKESDTKKTESTGNLLKEDSSDAFIPSIPKPIDSKTFQEAKEKFTRKTEKEDKKNSQCRPTSSTCSLNSISNDITKLKEEIKRLKKHFLNNNKTIDFQTEFKSIKTGNSIFTKFRFS